jgi:hypothetical protein
MGSSVFKLGSVLNAKGSTKAIKMTRGGGTLFVRAEKSVGQGTLHLHLNGTSLTNTEGFMRKSDPFYTFTRKDVGDRLVIHLIIYHLCFDCINIANFSL